MSNRAYVRSFEGIDEGSISTVGNPTPVLILLQLDAANGMAADSGSLTFPLTTSKGSTIIVVFLVSSGSAFGPTASVSDNNGNTYSLDSVGLFPSNSSGVLIASCTNVSAKVNHQVTADLTSAGSGDIAMVIYEYANLSRTSPTVAQTNTSPFTVTASRLVTFSGYSNGGSGVNLITLTSGVFDEQTPDAGLGFICRGSATYTATAAAVKVGASAAYG